MLSALYFFILGGGEQRKRKKIKMKDIDHSEFKTEIQFLEEKLKMIKHKFAGILICRGFQFL